MPALRPPTGGARRVPARALRLRRVLVAVLRMRRGLLRGPRHRAVPRRRAARVRGARARLPVLRDAALHGPRRSLRGGGAPRLLGMPRFLRELRADRLQPARTAEPARRAQGQPPAVPCLRALLPGQHQRAGRPGRGHAVRELRQAGVRHAPERLRPGRTGALHEAPAPHRQVTPPRM